MKRKSISNRERARLLAKCGGLKCAPLAMDEVGRGCQISNRRIQELEAECLRLLRLGFTQNQIRHLLKGSRSRISRWCIEAVLKNGGHTDHSSLRRRDRTTAQRLFDRIGFRTPEECWFWLGNTRDNGYGQFTTNTNQTTAHRAVYELFVGPIPDGMQIDHTCNNPGCVNPRHLQLAWPSENLTLGAMRRAQHA